MALSGSTLKGLITTDLATAGFILEPSSYMDKFLDAICNNVISHITNSSTLIATSTDEHGAIITGIVG